MLNKLIKIDLRSILIFAPIFFGVGLIFALISLICLKIGNSGILEIIGEISKNFALSAVISGTINIITRAIGVFWKKLYSDESYLTHTLPLSKKTIYLSKILSTFYSSLIAVIASIIILSINYNLFENFDSLKIFIETTAGITGGNVAEFIILLISLGFLEIFTLISIILFSIILKNRRKKIETAAISISIYFLVQTFFILVIFLIGLLNPEVMKLFENSETISTIAMKTIFYSGIAVYFIAVLAINKINIKLLEKGVNIA